MIAATCQIQRTVYEALNPCRHRTGIWPILTAFALCASLAPRAHAQMQLDNGCMEDVAGISLNCTANDVSVSAVTNITILDDGCSFLGDTVTFSADYSILLTAQERHDIGVYLATDGFNALNGSCTILTLPEVTDLDSECKSGTCSEDGTTACSPNENPSSDCTHIDTCGDLDAAPNPIILSGIVVTAQCIDPDGDGRLDLPNCTSWRQPGANEPCTSPLHAFPGAPSKCNCDPGFDVEICVRDRCTVSACVNDNSINCDCDFDCVAAGVGGICNRTKTPVDCSSFETACSTFACDPQGADGNCDAENPKPLSTVCEADGSLCTPDHCDGSGTCVANPGIPPVDCTGVDINQCTDTTCDPATGMCTVPAPKPLSTVCEADGSLCTPDHCDGAGSCVPNPAMPPVDCTGTKLNQCTNTSCDPATGMCTVPAPKPLSSPCEADASLCTPDHCDGAGNCVPNPAIPPVDCTGIMLNQCTDTTCDPSSGLCTVPDPKPLSTVCEADDSLCTPDHCDGAGNCVSNPGIPPVDCTGIMLNQCTDTTCDPDTGMCTVPDPKPFSTPCERDDPLGLCTVDHCDGTGQCVLLSTTMCDPAVGVCEAGERCNPDTGLCEMLSDAPLSTPCEADDDLCTHEHCDGAGSCVPNPGEPPVDCSGVMLNQCTDAACNPGTGMCTVPVFKPLSTVCEADDSLCTPDHCDGSGNCVPNPAMPPVDCTGIMLDQCNNADCDPATGMCTLPDPKPLSTPCEADANLCTPDHCNGFGDCVFNPAIPPVDCSEVELDQCNGAMCDPATGMCTVPAPKPLSTPCEADASVCTPDHCDGAGSCVPNPAIPPVDCTGIMLNQCTGTTCDPATGMCTVPDYKPLSTVCEADDSLCTPDHCDGAGNCVPNPGIPPVDCQCSLDCTECNPDTGTCEPSAGCDGSACPDDGASCTDDVCMDGVCTHTPVDGNCDDDVFCTNDRCDPGAPGANPTTGCVNEPVNANCNDAVSCTNPDVCNPTHPQADASGCVYTAQNFKCEDNNRCTNDVCDPVGAGQCVNSSNGLCGACCDGNTGTCTPDRLQGECVGSQITWHQNQSCSQINCLEHRGACCDRTSGGAVCTEDVFDHDCAGPDMTWYKGLTCDDVPSCRIIPTLSEWGMAALCLLLLIGLSLDARRRTA